MRKSPVRDAFQRSLTRYSFLFGVVGLGLTSMVGCTATVSGPGTSGTQGSGSNPSSSPAGSGSNSTGTSSGTSSTTPTGAGNGATGTAASNNPAGTVTAPAACTTVDPGRVTIHRLNILEYNNTVRDLLGDTTQPANAFPDDTGGANFDNNADVLATSPLLFSKMETAAEALATTAMTAGSASRASIVTCDSTKVGDTACATTVMTAFARKAWRRPVTATELSRLISFVPLAESNGDTFDVGITLGIEAVLLSPNFMFRPELDPDPTATVPRPLNSYEMASRLSYFLWSSMPDATLSAAADAGQLADVASVQTQATRMLNDAKAATMVSNLGGQWFGTYKMATVAPLATSFPTFDDTLRAAMTQETNLFLQDFLVGPTQSFLDALDANFTYVNARLAQHYGITGITGTAFQKVSLVGTKRSGLLTQGSILTTTSFPTRTSPVKRGQWVMANVLCTPPPAPPDNVPALEKTVVPAGSSVRVQLNAHIADPTCAACHQVMDPLGFGLEHFDGIGAWRDNDGSQPVDATGQLPSGVTFDGAQSEATALKQQTTQIASCATTKVFAYSLGRDPGPTDQCQLSQLSSSFSAANYNFRSLVMQMIASDTFRMRRPVAPGGQ
jgi:hypothetical protein